MATILCVYQRSEDADQLRTTLEADGHEVVFAHDRFRAVELFVEHRVNAAVLFFGTGSRETWELIPVLGRLDPRLPILTVAEDDTVETQREIRRSRVFYHLTQPVDADELRQAIREALAHPKAR